jgi:hypothetical protein
MPCAQNGAGKKFCRAAFGDSNWQSELQPNLPMKQLSAQILALYKRLLRSVVSYAFAFAMNSREGQLNYHLVFASQHHLGLEKMKEAVKAVNQTETYSFSDDTVGQDLLKFDFNDPVIWAGRMQRTLSGKWNSYDELRKFALNETPFTNPKGMLKHLDGQGLLDVESIGDRRKSSFPEEKIKRVFVHQSLL